MYEPKHKFESALIRIKKRVEGQRNASISLKVKKTRGKSEEKFDNLYNKRISIKVNQTGKESPISIQKLIGKHESPHNLMYPLILKPETFHKQFKVRRKSGLLKKISTPISLNKFKDNLSAYGVFFNNSPINL